jgi:hypothetical protein
MTVCALCRQKVCAEVVGPLLHCLKYLQHDNQKITSMSHESQLLFVLATAGNDASSSVTLHT